MLTAKETAYAALFAALTAVGAQIAIPLPLVPITLQVVMTLLAGAVLGKRVGFISQAVYVLMGAVGLPVFAARQGGVAILFGPSGGYLIGFIFAAWVVGWLFEQERKMKGRPRWLREIIKVAALIVGLIVIYIPGVAVLSLHVGSLRTAFTVGVITFLPGDLLKCAVAWFIARGLHARGIGSAFMP